MHRDAEQRPGEPVGDGLMLDSGCLEDGLARERSRVVDGVGDALGEERDAERVADRRVSVGLDEGLGIDADLVLFDNPPTDATSATPGTLSSAYRTFQSWTARSS